MSQSTDRIPERHSRSGGPVPSESNGITTENGKMPVSVNKQTNPIPSTQPTDTYIPQYLNELVPELRYYEQLKESERRVDVFLARKRIDLQQNISQWNNSKLSPITSHNRRDVTYLRIFISNVAENQPWQNGNNDIQNASWTMRIEGRLLNPQNVQDPTRPKFSSFLQAIAVDFKKPKENEETGDDTNSKDDHNSQNMEMNEAKSHSSLMGLSLPIPGVSSSNDNTGQEDKPKSDIADAVEWHFDPVNPVDFDGLDIKRNGSENVDCTITIQLKDVTAERLEYSSELASLIGLSQGSLHDAIYSLYKYILINDLLTNGETSLRTSTHPSSDTTNSERTRVKLDPTLTKLIYQTPTKKSPTTSDDEPLPATLPLSQILKLVNFHVSPVRAIKANYTVRVDKASTYGELVFDVEVPNLGQRRNLSENNQLKKEGLSLLSDFNKLTSDLKPQLQELETRGATLQLQLNASAKKYQFFEELSKNPVGVLQEYVASSSNALKVLSGDEGFNEDTVRRSQFYSDNEQMLFESLGVLLSNGRM